MIKIFARLSGLLVLLCGPICLPLVPRLLHVSLGFYLERYLAFLLVGASWSILRQLFMVVMRRHQHSRRRLLRWLAALAFVTLTVIFFLSLQSFRIKFEDYIFYTLLALLCLDALAESLRQRQHLVAALLLGLGAHAGLGYLSVLVISNVWWWPPLLVAIGVACVAISMPVAESIGADADQEVRSSLSRTQIQISRIYPLLICLGAVLVSVPSAFKLAPSRFLLMLLIIPLSTPVINHARLVGAGERAAGLLREATGICYLFMVMLLLLAII
ncbi:MAG: hypothetical protein K1X83_14860 [Oligoflexia bacterium]|nr:hypothetical protein [Oligoflexia bacterium]